MSFFFNIRYYSLEVNILRVNNSDIKQKWHEKFALFYTPNTQQNVRIWVNANKALKIPVAK